MYNRKITHKACKKSFGIFNFAMSKAREEEERSKVASEVRGLDVCVRVCVLDSDEDRSPPESPSPPPPHTPAFCRVNAFVCACVHLEGWAQRGARVGVSVWMCSWEVVGGGWRSEVTRV